MCNVMAVVMSGLPAVITAVAALIVSVTALIKVIEQARRNGTMLAAAATERHSSDVEAPAAPPRATDAPANGGGASDLPAA